MSVTPFTQRLEFPTNASQEFMHYIFSALEFYHGFPGDLYFSRSSGSNFTACFFSAEDMGKFNITYGNALNGKINERIWEKANGPILTGNLTKHSLLDFGKLMGDIMPAIIFIDTHGGWFNGSDFPGFFALESALSADKEPSSLRSAYEETAKFMSIISLIQDAFDTDFDPNKSGNMYRTNIAHLFIRFQNFKDQFLMVYNFIITNGGFGQNDTDSFPGFDALCKAVNDKNLSEDLKNSIIAVKNIIEIYQPVKEAIGKEIDFAIFPHNS